MSYSCKDCNDTFRTKQQFERHLASKKHKIRASNVVQIKLFECLGCNRKYSHASTLSHHKSTCKGLLLKKDEVEKRIIKVTQENADLTATITSLRAQICSLEKKLEQAKTQTTLVQHGRRKINQKIRQTIATNQDHKCNDCKNTLTKYFQIDHLIGLQYGGTDETDNLQALCGDCHTKKSVIENRVRRKIQDAIRSILQEEEESS